MPYNFKYPSGKIPRQEDPVESAINRVNVVKDKKGKDADPADIALLEKQIGDSCLARRAREALLMYKNARGLLR